MNSYPKSGTKAGAGDNVLAIVEKTVADYSGVAESVLPVSEASVVQLQPGSEPTNLTIFSSEKVSVLGMQHGAPSVGVIIMKPAYFGFMWWDGSDDCRINGERARRQAIYSQGSQGGFHAVGGARRTIGIAVRRKELVETIATLRGVGPEDVMLEHSALALSHDAAVKFRTDFELRIRNAIDPKPRGSTCDPKADHGEAFFGLLVDAYLHSQPSWLRKNRPTNPAQIVRKAEERFFASRGSPVSLADLCAAARVSQATLYRAFHAVCGEPPLAYFHKRKLTDARRALIKSPVSRGAVKRAALSCGLTELGRFAVEYRHLFGESPSATLNRSLPL